MRRIDLIISHEHFLEVNELLRKYNVDDMTFYSVRGRGRSKQEEVSTRNEIVRSVPEFVTGTKIESKIIRRTTKTSFGFSISASKSSLFVISLLRIEAVPSYQHFKPSFTFLLLH